LRMLGLGPSGVAPSMRRQGSPVQTELPAVLDSARRRADACGMGGDELLDLLPRVHSVARPSRVWSNVPGVDRSSGQRPISAGIRTPLPKDITASGWSGRRRACRPGCAAAFASGNSTGCPSRKVPQRRRPVQGEAMSRSSRRIHPRHRNRFITRGCAAAARAGGAEVDLSARYATPYFRT